MRFTTSKEAGNPHADFISRLVDSLCIVVKECAEVTAKLLGNYVFAEFLFQTPVIICITLITPLMSLSMSFWNIFCIFTLLPPLQQIECPIIIAFFELVE